MYDRYIGVKAAKPIIELNTAHCQSMWLTSYILTLGYTKG